MEQVQTLLAEKDAKIVLGVFYDSDREPDSEYRHFMKAALFLASIGHFDLGLVTNQGLIKTLKNKKIISYFDLIFMKKKLGPARILDLATKAVDVDIENWMLKNSLEIVEKLTPETLPIYSRLGLPMLLLFLNPGSLSIDSDLESARSVAESAVDSVVVAWVDGTDATNKNKRRELGLLTDVLPAAAFNVQDDRILPFDEGKPLTHANLSQFVQDFIANRLVSKGQFQGKTRAIGVETVLAKIPGLKYSDFKEKVMTEGKDVCVFFYSSSESDRDLLERSNAVARSFVHMQSRMEDWGVKTVGLYRLDTASEPVPRNINIDYTPSMFLFPAFHKTPPFVQYVGNNDNMQMFLFIAQGVDIKMRVPELKELTEEEKGSYNTHKSTLSTTIKEAVEVSERVRDVDWL